MTGTTPGNDSGPLLIKQGFVLREYRFISFLGEGGFSDVWKADKGGLEVAIKILKTSLSSKETQREIKTLESLKNLRHKHLLHTEKSWVEGDRLFIEMELAEGGSLKDRLRACKRDGLPGIPVAELLKYFNETTDALSYLHAQVPQLLHRDIKPGNILLVKGCAKLADFDLLKQLAFDHSQTVTQGGTFPYMAPESMKDDIFSVFTDLFALAVTYVELRQGKLPFFGKNQFEFYEKILKDSPELSGAFQPEERKVLLVALDKDSRNRFRSCAEFISELNKAVRPMAPPLDRQSFPDDFRTIKPNQEGDEFASSGNDREDPTFVVPETPADSDAAASRPTQKSSNEMTPSHPESKKPRRRFPMRILVGIFVLALVGGIWFFVIKEKLSNGNGKDKSVVENKTNEIKDGDKKDDKKRDEINEDDKKFKTLLSLEKNKDFPELSKKVQDLAGYREKHPGIQWKHDLGKFTLVPVLANAWQSLTGNVDIEECQRQLDVVEKGKRQIKGIERETTPNLDAYLDANVRAIKAIIKGHAPDNSGQAKTIQEIILLVRENDQPELNRNLWKALVQLEKSKALLDFQDLVALHKTLPEVGADNEVKEADAQLRAATLERLARQPNGWIPGKDEMAICARLCNGIERPTDWIKALRAECQVEAGADLTDGIQTVSNLKADWYGSYVHALVLTKSKDSPKAADILTNLLKEHSKALKPPPRAGKAFTLLRKAARDLMGDDKQFKTEKDAKRAIAWISTTLDALESAKQPQQDEQTVDDLIVLAFAAAKADREYLKKVAGKLERANKVNAYYWLAKAYWAEGNSEKEVFDSFDKAVNLKETSADEARQLAAKDATVFALQRAAKEFETGNSVKSIDYGKKWRMFAYRLKDPELNMDLEKAADLYRKAVKIHVDSVLAKTAEENKETELYDLYRDILDEPLVAFHVPVVVEKLIASKRNHATEHLEATIKEGQVALKLAELELNRRKNPFWKEVRFEAMLELASTRTDLLARNLKKLKTPEKIKELQGIVELYKSARSEFSEKRKGEVAFRIGSGYFLIGQLRGEKIPEDMQFEAGRMEFEKAQKELKAGFQLWEKMPAPVRVVWEKHLQWVEGNLKKK